MIFAVILCPFLAIPIFLGPFSTFWLATVQYSTGTVWYSTAALHYPGCAGFPAALARPFASTRPRARALALALTELVLGADSFGDNRHGTGTVQHSTAQHAGEFDTTPRRGVYVIPRHPRPAGGRADELRGSRWWTRLMQGWGAEQRRVGRRALTQGRAVRCAGQGRRGQE